MARDVRDARVPRRPWMAESGPDRVESDVSAARIVAQLAGKKTAAREDRRLVSKAGNQPRLVAIPARQVAAAASIR